MNEVVPIHGRGNFPTLEVKLCDLVSLVRTKLEQDNISVKEIRWDNTQLLLSKTKLRQLFLLIVLSNAADDLLNY